MPCSERGCPSISDVCSKLHLPYPSRCFYKSKIVDGISRREEHIQSLHLALVGDIAGIENICVSRVKRPTVPRSELSFQSIVLAFCFWDDNFQLNLAQNKPRKKYEFKVRKDIHYIPPAPLACGSGWQTVEGDKTGLSGLITISIRSICIFVFWKLFHTGGHGKQLKITTILSSALDVTEDLNFPLLICSAPQEACLPTRCYCERLVMHADAGSVWSRF